MSSPMYTPGTDRELVVVYPTEQQARAAARRLEELGVAAGSIRIDAETHRTAALRAEMRESAKGILYLGTIATVVALVIAAPLAFVDYGSTLGVRLVTHVVIALIFGGLVGFFAGGAHDAEPPNELLAAQWGTVLRVDQDTPAVRAALTSLEPIRVAEVGAEGTPLDTVVTEGDAEDVGVAQERPANLRGDGYHPAEAPVRDADIER